MQRVLVYVGLGYSWLLALPVQAQIAPDGTLNTQVTSSDGLHFTLTHGTAVGNHLFHSLREFSIPTGGSATFDLINTPNISTIFSRVTGTTGSHIDGLIQTLNHSNPVSLFLINPNGILFGNNAQLNLSSSFISTTASSLQFSDGNYFSAVNSSETPLLTISAPLPSALAIASTIQMGITPGTIILQGQGHQLTSQSPIFAPFVPTGLHPGLRVRPGNTLALIGGNIALNGGILTAPEGRIELGSIAPNQQVRLNPQDFRLDYVDTHGFADIALRQRSLLDVNGREAGSIQVQGRQISLTDGSLFWIQNRGQRSAGDLVVSATERLILSGTSPDLGTVSGIVNETVGGGTSGNITVSTPNLIVESGARIANRTYSSAPSGTVSINAAIFEVKGYAPVLPDLFTLVGSQTFSAGRAGDVSVSSQQLSIIDGGYLGSSTLGSGRGGNIGVNADTIAVRGATPSLIPSLIAASTTGQSGNAGDLTINTRSLLLRNSGLVATSSVGLGSAGNLTVNASEEIDIGGRFSEDLYPSAIATTVDYAPPGYRQAFGLSGIPTGDSGNVAISTPRLKISDDGAVTTANRGIGNAGTLKLNAGTIEVKNAFIDAFTNSGEGGNILIQAERVILRRNSSIQATAFGIGNGGNVSIDAPIILGWENSDIIANAFNGRGGNIQITTQRIFGLKLRDRLTPENDITASSEFGINGTVQITTPNIEPNAGLIELPTDLIDQTQQISHECSPAQGSSFVITGRGGLPQNPLEQMRGDQTWADLRDLSTFKNQGSVRATTPSSEAPIVEATTWYRTSEGQIKLIASPSMPTILSIACAIPVSR